MISLKRCRGKDFSVWIPVIFVLAAVIRVLFLDLKPTHFDEGVNGWFVEQIKTNGTFNYNPENFHGPLYFYLLYVVDFIFGSEIYIHRFVPILCSLGAIFTFYKTSLFLKEKHLAGVLALSLSPALVFYARYSIHESLLLFGFSIWFYGCIELLVKASQKALWLLAIGLAVMATTKETFLIFVINSVIAFLIVRL